MSQRVWRLGMVRDLRLSPSLAATIVHTHTLGARRQVVPTAEKHPWNLISEPGLPESARRTAEGSEP